MTLKAWTYPVLLLCLLGLQVLYWRQTHTNTPDMTIVPTPPGATALDVLSFGDGEFLFRAMAFEMGNAGDTFGRITPLYKYDLKKVHQWFSLLDRFNHDSNLLPTLAAYYYSQTQTREDARHMVDYLFEHAMADISKKWWWLVQAGYIALHRVGDSDLALKVSSPLVGAPGVPVAMQQFPALVHEQRGEFSDALYIMEGILESEQEIPDQELRYMRYFVEERLDSLEELDEKARHRLEAAPPAPQSPE